MASQIFISYRREDTAGHARNLHRELLRWFGERQIFFDLATLKVGDVFPDELNQAVQGCSVLLAFIGPAWAQAERAGQRRLLDPADFVRKEIALALSLNKMVIPVLLDNAEMPRAADLPNELLQLLNCQAHHQRGYAGEYDDGVRRLVRSLGKVPGVPRPRPSPRHIVGIVPRLPIATKFFTGRISELETIHRAIGMPREDEEKHDEDRVGPTIRRFAIHGAPGIGKSTLAIEYATKYNEDYEAVRWCKAEKLEDLIESLADLAKEIGVANEGAPPELSARECLKHLQAVGSSWLLVYDNWQGATVDAEEFLPPGNVALLITSRSPASEEICGASLELGELSRQEAVALLMSKSGKMDREGAGVLVDLLGGFPLELDHAGALCGRSNYPISFQEYAQRVSELMVKLPKNSRYRSSTAATFEMAISAAERDCSSAPQLMTYIAYCAPDNIPLSLLQGATKDYAELLSGLHALRSVSLIQYGEGDDAPPVRVHRTIQVVRRGQADKDGKMRDAAENVLAAKLVELFPDHGYEDHAQWNVCAQLAPHALALWELRKSNSTNVDLCTVVDRVAMYLLGRSAENGLQMRRSRELLEEVLSHRQNYVSTSKADLALSMSNLALVYHYEGNLAEARSLGWEALTLREAIQDPKLSWSQNNYGYILMDQGQPREALPWFEKALRLTVDDPTMPPEEIGVAYDNLGLVHLRLGDLDAAEHCFELALKYYRTARGDSAHSDVGLAQYHIGKVLCRKGALAEALNRCQAALSIYADTIADDHIDNGEVLNEVGEIYRKLGNTREAQECFQRAIEVFEKSGAPDHHDAAAPCHNLAGILQERSDFTAAKTLLERALKIRVDALGDDNAESVRTRSDLDAVLSHIK